MQGSKSELVCEGSDRRFGYLRIRRPRKGKVPGVRGAGSRERACRGGLSVR